MNTLPLTITRCALLTPFDMPDAAQGWAGTWEALCAGRRIEHRTAVDDRLLEGPDTLDRSIRMGLAVARRAAGGGSIQDTALFCGTSKGPVGIVLDALARVRRGEALPVEHARHIALGVGAMGAYLADALAIRDVVHTSVAACASGLFALHRAVRALRTGACRRALVVAADASLHPLFEASFARLGVLAPADDAGIRRCEPFGREGRGFFLSEAAVALLLEPAEQGLARVESTWIGGDGTGLVAVDDQTDTLRRGLHAISACPGAALAPAFVHAHATGTRHDRFEMEAIRAVLGDGPRVFSTKGQLGHSLGAAGLLSVALSVLSHHRGRTPDGTWVAPDGSSVTVAQGFGGHVGVVRLKGTR